MATDFTGKRQGRFIVNSLSRRGSYGGKNVNFWLCICDCGRSEEIPQPKMASRWECAVCQRGPCIICGGEIQDSRARSNTCCDECEAEKRRAISLKHYAKVASPTYNKARYKQQKQREDANPDLAIKRRDREKINKAVYRSKPDVIARNKKYQNKRWQELKELIAIQRAAYLDSLSPEQQCFRRQKQRDYNREYRRNFREWLYSHPEEHQKYIDKQREWAAERNRRKALAELITESQKILKRNKLDE